MLVKIIRLKTFIWFPRRLGRLDKHNMARSTEKNMRSAGRIQNVYKEERVNGTRYLSQNIKVSSPRFSILFVNFTFKI